MVTDIPLTVRQQIAQAIDGQTRSARELAHMLRVPERDIEAHLEHIAKSIDGERARRRREGLEDRTFQLLPAVCDDCGFVFRDRTRLTTPSRCPQCRSEHIMPPRYGIMPVR